MAAGNVWSTEELWLCPDLLLPWALPLPSPVCAAAGSVSGTFSADSVEEEVFENERFARGLQGSQWSPANLLAGQDPRRYMYALQQADAFPQVRACTCASASCGGVTCVSSGRS